MRLEPVGSWKHPDAWMNAKAVLHQLPGSKIIRPGDATKGSTRFYLIEAVSPEAKESGYEVGDLIIAKHAYDILFYNGAYHRVSVQVKEVMQRVRDFDLKEFIEVLGGKPVLQEATENGRAPSAAAGAEAQ